MVYGGRNEPQTIEITLKDLENLIHHSASENVLVDLSIENDARAKRLALMQEVQHHPLSGRVLHVDLHEVLEDEKVVVTVPVETTGEAAGVKTGGGVLEHVLFKIRVRALPKDLPEAITVDVTNLEIGQSIHIGDLQAPEGVEILGEKAISVIAVAAPITEAQETAAAEAAAAAAPTALEVIKEKKEEAGAAAGAAPAAAPAGEKGAAEKKPKK